MWKDNGDLDLNRYNPVSMFKLQIFYGRGHEIWGVEVVVFYPRMERDTLEEPLENS